MPEIQGDEVRSAIEGLRLPAVVLRIFDGENVHPALSFRAESPYYSFTDGSGLDSTFLPFWECGVSISGYSRSLAEYQKINLETPDAPSFSSTTFRGLFCDLLIFLWEDEHEEATLSELTTLFEMPSIEQLLHRLENQPPYSVEWDAWRANVIEQYENS
jgi:hypothetical protein